MKNKDIAKICKRNKVIAVVTDTDGTQWVGDGVALYPLLKMPELNEEGFYALFDINDKQSVGYSFKQTNLLGGTSLEDAISEENELKWIPLTISCESRELKPIITSQGLYFIDEDYIKPACSESYMKIFERYNAKGELYFAVKNGLMLVAIITPYKLNDSSAEIIKLLAQQLELAELNKTEE